MWKQIITSAIVFMNISQASGADCRMRAENGKLELKRSLALLSAEILIEDNVATRHHLVGLSTAVSAQGDAVTMYDDAADPKYCKEASDPIVIAMLKHINTKSKQFGLKEMTCQQLVQRIKRGRSGEFCPYSKPSPLTPAHIQELVSNEILRKGITKTMVSQHLGNDAAKIYFP